MSTSSHTRWREPEVIVGGGPIGLFHVPPLPRCEQAVLVGVGHATAPATSH